jgi:hypothetical protein
MHIARRKPGEHKVWKQIKGSATRSIKPRKFEYDIYGVHDHFA